jgi:hypothetical protein
MILSSRSDGRRPVTRLTPQMLRIELICSKRASATRNAASPGPERAEPAGASRPVACDAPAGQLASALTGPPTAVPWHALHLGQGAEIVGLPGDLHPDQQAREQALIAAALAGRLPGDARQL